MRSWTPIGGLPHGSVPALAPSLPLLGHPLQPPAVRDNPRLSHPHTFPVGARGLVLFLLDCWTAACRGGVTRGTCSRVRHATGGLCQRAFPALPPHWRRGAVRRGLAGHAHAPLPSLALICRNQMQTADHPNANPLLLLLLLPLPTRSESIQIRDFALRCRAMPCCKPVWLQRHHCWHPCGSFSQHKKQVLSPGYKQESCFGFRWMICCMVFLAFRSTSGLLFSGCFFHFCFQLHLKVSNSYGKLVFERNI